MLISVHIPKTAGTAFGALLEARFGARLLKDYEDHPLSHPPLRRITSSLGQLPLARRRLHGYDAVHGHFLALKYLAARGDVVTWLRDPVQRAVSRYEHYRRDVVEGRPLQAATGLKPGLTLEDFVEIPSFHNTYAKYFRGFPLHRVRCFGFSEDMAEGLGRMKRSLGLELGTAVRVNANPFKDEAHYEIPDTIQRRVIALNGADYRLWQWAHEREGV